jgi:hypothetical protein
MRAICRNYVFFYVKFGWAFTVGIVLAVLLAVATGRFDAADLPLVAGPFVSFHVASFIAITISTFVNRRSK